MKKLIIITVSFYLLFNIQSCKQNGDMAKKKAQEFEVVSRELDELENKGKNTQNLNQSNQMAPVYNIKVIKTYPHDPQAYTQGLLYHNGFFYESTGLVGKSSLRKVEVESGKIVQRYDLKGGHFAEGIEIYNGKIYQLTWVSQTCFVYDVGTFNLITQYNYRGEGWGLSKIEDMLLMSNGSAQIKFVNPESFETVKTITVSDGGQKISELNELEYIDGEIWSNVYGTDKIARINPETGFVNSWLDLSPLYKFLSPGDDYEVLNGIAYDNKSKRIFVTGKLWKWVFEIEVEEKSH